MSEKLDYAERAGMENMRERIDVAGMIQREANTTMTLLLAGAGAALAYTANPDAIPATGKAALAVSAYLFALAGLLTRTCLGLIAYPAVANEPKNLSQDSYTSNQIREWELENLQVRIDESVRINEYRSRWLNRCRIAAALTPVIAVVAWVAAL
jgi:hypothetical protein